MEPQNNFFNQTQLTKFCLNYISNITYGLTLMDTN